MSRLFALACCLGVAACAPPPLPPPSFLASPADPARDVAPLRVGDAAAGSRHFKVVGPRDWTRINRDIAPELRETPQ